MKNTLQFCLIIKDLEFHRFFNSENASLIQLNKIKLNENRTGGRSLEKYIL